MSSIDIVKRENCSLKTKEENLNYTEKLCIYSYFEAYIKIISYTRTVVKERRKTRKLEN